MPAQGFIEGQMGSQGFWLAMCKPSWCKAKQRKGEEMGKAHRTEELPVSMEPLGSKGRYRRDEEVS